MSSLHEKLDILAEKLDRVTAITAENTASLKEHIRRTELLEQLIPPLQSHVTKMGVIVPLLAALGTAMGVLAAVVALIRGG